MKIIFDIGGTNMRISYIDGNEIGSVLKVSTPKNLENAKKTIIESVKKISKGEKVDSIVGGVPGTVQNGILVVATNLKDWKGFDIKSFLQENFSEKVAVYNDADLAGLGESLYGAGRGNKIVAYIGIGTGVGGVRIVDGMIDANGFGFEPGHHIMDTVNGKTFEDFVSGRALLEKYNKPTENIGQVEIEKLTPVLAAGIYNTMLFWSPDIMIIGGSLLNEKTAFKIENINKSLEKIKNGKTLPGVKKAELDDNSGLYGALVMTERMA